VMIPEVVLMENEHGCMLQINSLGPVYSGRIERFVRMCRNAPKHLCKPIEYRLINDDYETWCDAVAQAKDAFSRGRVSKVVLSRRLELIASHPFSSKDLLVNLIDGDAKGTVVMYRYGDVFFCGCTPELLLRKTGEHIESMCLAGTCPAGKDGQERKKLADELLHDAKNRAEHDHVVRFIDAVLSRTCYDVHTPAEPEILSLSHVQHLYTPVTATALEGMTLDDLAFELHPTPATAGSPVGEAKMLIRRIEPYNRGFYAGTCGYEDSCGNGEISVALRTGIFDGERGYVFGGCGIVEASDPDSEYKEIDLKLKTILSAFDGPKKE
ncbi:MAG: isochorismate synthase, partial [Eggerthellaceae bacterium]|nr:isochorismate synthase [Eggerthellaceae bacterium]